MLWNWYTVDSCFIASSWHNTSSGMFAGSCIGVILLTMSLEFLRRSVKEFDRYLVRKHAAPTVSPNGSLPGSKGAAECAFPAAAATAGYRPTVVEQAIRAFLHMVQFAVAYFIML
jgi:copper transporter 1